MVWSSMRSGDGGEESCAVKPRDAGGEEVSTVDEMDVKDCDEENGDEGNGDDVTGKEPKDESGEDLMAEGDGEDPCRGTGG